MVAPTGWERTVRRRFGFLADLDDDERRWAACDPRDRFEVGPPSPAAGSRSGRRRRRGWAEDPIGVTERLMTLYPGDGRVLCLRVPRRGTLTTPLTAPATSPCSSPRTLAGGPSVRRHGRHPAAGRPGNPTPPTPQRQRGRSSAQATPTRRPPTQQPRHRRTSRTPFVLASGLRRLRGTDVGVVV